MRNPEFIGIRFRPSDEVAYLHSLDIPVGMHDRVLVRLDKGKDVAKVVAVFEPGEFTGRTEDAWRLLRVATREDLDRLADNAEREREAFAVCESKIKKLRLPMRLLRVRTLFDGSRITFYFKAANKVDFRQLVRQLAAVFKARIELRQVGARDETELIGGIGLCGRQICCSYWRCRTVKWCRDNKSPRSKVPGLCNRTLCCLKYESTELDGKTAQERRRPGRDATGEGDGPAPPAERVARRGGRRSPADDGHAPQPDDADVQPPPDEDPADLVDGPEYADADPRAAAVRPDDGAPDGAHDDATDDATDEARDEARLPETGDGAPPLRDAGGEPPDELDEDGREDR